VRKAVLTARWDPIYWKTPDILKAWDAAVFNGIRVAIKADRPAFLLDFLHNFYNYGYDREESS